MADLGTTYLGIRIANPVVVAASGLVSNINGVEKAARAGAGAITLKSLFEEQIEAEVAAAESSLPPGANSEAAEYLRGMGLHAGANDYLALIRGAKQAVGVPVVASVNCAAGPWWTEFANQIESAGADALELNIGFVPLDGSESAEKIEDRVVSIVRDVRAATRLPLAVKVGPDWTNLNHLAPRLVEAGARALVLFNRFYRLDVDLDAMKLKAGPTRAGAEDYHETLRWIGMLDGRLRDAELVAGNGVRDAETALRLVASGASAVQVCSLVYEKGYDAIGGLARAMSARLDALGLADLKSLRGRLSRRMSDKPEAWGRAQYVQALTGMS
ncbi:MAG: dihydroorotate dehydrogenase-like protein [Spirochaetia bacterium]|nr:dihydroorotate dehydrogenase-like protein [Spirochaetia bacterium]